MLKNYRELITFLKPQENMSLNMFNTEVFFWLTTATSISFAVEELEKGCKTFPQLIFQGVPLRSTPFIELFKKCVRSERISLEIIREAKKGTLHNLNILANFSKRNSIKFIPEVGIILGKTFSTYWLVYKLIELEWQQVLSFEESKEIYMLLDNVIIDHKELEKMENQYISNKTLSPDDLLYLRSHWQRVKQFWLTLYNDLKLMTDGWIDFNLPYKM